MASTAADVLIESLQDWGVEIIFGLPGERQAGLPSGPVNPKHLAAVQEPASWR